MDAEDGKLWERFLGHAARARAKPTFDAEERDWKFRIAKPLHGVLRAARGRDEWLPALENVYQIGQRFNLIAPGHWEWLAAWASADPESLRMALAAFLDPDAQAEDRFASFVRAAEELKMKGRITLDAYAALALGSLFNFALAPKSLPMMRAARFDELEQIMGQESLEGASVAAAYANHLAFARDLQTRMEKAGCAVRDMIDVQSLIFIAAIERDFWAVDRPHDVTASPPADQRDPGKDDAAKAKPYLCVCAIYRNEAPYLREWIEFHRLVGVERFFLYDNLSTDAHQEALAPYLEDGFVTLHEWKVVPPPDQRDTYDHCLSEHRHDSRWIAFIDTDEFLFSPTGRPLPDLLVDYERWPGVGVNWAVFGTSGHRTKPPGLVLENYLMRADAPSSRLIKSIVDPTRVVRCGGPHHFIYRSLLAIDENRYPIHGPTTKSVSFSRFRINHYVTKSEAEARSKVGRGSRFGWDSLEPWRSSQRERRFHQELDQAITIYVPDLREALARTAARQPDPFPDPST